MTRVNSILIIKSLLKDFGASDNIIIKSCVETERKDNVDMAICSEMRELYGDEDDDSNVAWEAFHRFLKNSIGFWTDWKYTDETVEWCLNKDYMLKKHGLRLSFSPHERNDIFEISLYDSATGSCLDKTTFRYSSDGYHDMHELINKVNMLIEKRGLILLDADEGADSFVFIMLTFREYKRLNEKYGDIDLLLKYDKFRDYVNSA